jgi:hypothetical protein
MSLFYDMNDMVNMTFRGPAKLSGLSLVNDMTWHCLLSHMNHLGSAQSRLPRPRAFLV